MSQYNFELGLQVETLPCDAAGNLVDESSFSEYRVVVLKKIINKSQVFYAKDLDAQDHIEAAAFHWLHPQPLNTNQILTPDQQRDLARIDALDQVVKFEQEIKKS